MSKKQVDICNKCDFDLSTNYIIDKLPVVLAYPALLVFLAVPFLPEKQSGHGPWWWRK
jgi:hypothetical protein